VLFTTTATPLNLPKKHSRSYYATTIGNRHLMRYYPRYHSPKTWPADDWHTANWGDWASQPNRRYFAMITNWWKTNNVPNGKPWWAALAAAHPIIGSDGISRTVRADRWFLWYQRQALAAFGNTCAPFFPVKKYVLGPTPYSFIDFPDYPRLPWNPPAPFALLTCSGAVPYPIRVTIHVPTLTEQANWYCRVAVHNPLQPGTLWPTMRDGYFGFQGITVVPVDIDMQAYPSLAIPTGTTGSTFRVWVTRWDIDNQQPSTPAYIDGQFS
jgi:hypothetical protein